MKFKRKSKLFVALSMILVVVIASGAIITGLYAQTNTIVQNDNNDTNTASQSQMDSAGLDIMKQTGNWESVKPLLQYMSPDGITNVVNLYIEMIAKQESPNELKNEETVTPQLTPNTANSNVNTTQNEIDTQALEIIQNTGNIKYIEHMLPNMSSGGVDKVALEVMQKTGNWKYLEPMLSYMTNSGIDTVVALWNQKHPNQTSKSASNYYNTTDKNSVDTKSQPGVTTDYDEVAKTVIQETNDLNSIVELAPLMSAEVLDEIVTSHVNTANDFNKTYALRQYMSTDGIDKLVKDYIDRTHDFGTVGAMLQFMSKEASNYVANKYFQESSNRIYDWIFSPYMN